MQTLDDTITISKADTYSAGTWPVHFVNGMGYWTTVYRRNTNKLPQHFSNSTHEFDQLHLPHTTFDSCHFQICFRNWFYAGQSVKMWIWELRSSGIWYMIYLLTAIGLSPGGSSTVHIYTQTIHRTIQNKQYIEQHNNWKSAGRAPSWLVIPWHLPYNRGKSTKKPQSG